jgi:hypothetical protein
MRHELRAVQAALAKLGRTSVERAGRGEAAWSTALAAMRAELGGGAREGAERLAALEEVVRAEVIATTALVATTY